MLSLSLFLMQLAPQVETPAEMSFGWLLVKTILAMALILGLAILFIKYLMPKFSNGMARSGGHMIKVLDRMPIDARRSLMIIQVENKKSVIGVSEAGFTHVMDLTGE